MSPNYVTCEDSRSCTNPAIGYVGDESAFAGRDLHPVCSDCMTGDEDVVREFEAPSEGHVYDVVADLARTGPATTEAVVATIVERYDVEKVDAEAVVRRALMCGVCYKPRDGQLARV